jgi:diguanylate cyclase (GGDEF)-like protein
VNTLFEDFDINELQSFYVDLGRVLVRHHDARLSLFYLLHFLDARDCNKGNHYLILHKLDFSELLVQANQRFPNYSRIVAIQDRLSLLVDYVSFVLNRKCDQPIDKDSYRHLLALMKNLDKSIENFRKDITHTLAYIDELTGLLNRSALEHDLDKQLHEVMSGTANHCLALIDVDNFKEINDTHGHVVGDDVLERISDIILSTLRSNDKAYRYGGEEILVSLAHCSLTDATTAMERVRANIGEHVFESEDAQLSVTVSIGIAAIEKNDISYRDVIDRADQLLYKAKQSGKNVVLY